MDRVWSGLKALGGEVWEIICGGLGNMVRWKGWYLLGFCLLAGVVFFTWQQDASWLARLRVQDETVIRVARKISYWGDYLTWTVPFGLVLLGLGCLCKKRYWRRMAIACVLAASMAGLCANLLSFAAGRPRPSAGKPDGLYGPQMDYGTFRSFPSGHAATSFGTATALAVAAPPLGVPCLIFAGSVGWSRMELDRHFPTDVFVGSVLGIAFGIAFGAAARFPASRGSK